MPHSSAKPLLEVTGLRRYFGGHSAKRAIRAVEDVSFFVRAGETLGLVGESGCGKSTTGRMIVELETPNAGSIQFNGKDLADLSAKEWRAQRRNLQIVFQNPQSALDPRLTIRRQIREPLDLHQIGPAADRDNVVTALMDAVSLSPGTRRPLSPSDQRRSGATGRHRKGARAQSDAHRLRRARLGARRISTG